MKGQIRITETITAIFILFIIIVFSLIFYAQYRKGAAQEEFKEVLAEQGLDTSLVLSKLPELRCTKQEDIAVSNCIDKIKLEKAAEVITANEGYYFDLIGFANVTVQQVYPAGDIVVLYEFTRNTSQKIFVPVPINIFNPLAEPEKRYSLGVLNIEIQ